jgi:hypothetical protein
VPLVVPEVPAVVPAVELVAVEVDPDPLTLGRAFVKMNDAPAADPDGGRDAVPDVVVVLVDVVVVLVVPVVPAALAMSPRCKHPTRMIVPA